MKFGTVAMGHLALGLLIVGYGGLTGWWNLPLFGLTPMELIAASMGAFALGVMVEMGTFDSDLIIASAEPILLTPNFSAASLVALSYARTEDAIRALPSFKGSARPCEYCGTTKGYGEFKTCLSCGAPKPKGA